MLRHSLLCLHNARIFKPTPPPEQKVFSVTSKGLQVRLHVKPNSKLERITDVQHDCVHVAVTEVARDGDANRGVIDLMSSVLGFRKSDTVVVAGHKSRDKVILFYSEISFASEELQSEELVRMMQKLNQAILH